MNRKQDREDLLSYRKEIKDLIVRIRQNFMSTGIDDMHDEWTRKKSIEVCDALNEADCILNGFENQLLGGDYE